MSKEALSSKQAVKTSEVNVIDGYNLAQITDGYDLVETTDWYESVEKSDEGKVLLGENGTCDAKETSSIEIATHDRMIIMLTNVSYVLELKRNIISLGELDRSGCTIKFENGVMKVTKCSLVKLRETLRHGLYVLEGTTVSGTVTIVSGKVTDMCMLWHKRLAYSQEERILIDEGAFIEESSSNNDLQNYQLARDRAQREIHAPIRYGYADLVAYALTCATDNIKADPLTFEDAIVSDSQKQWKDPMEAELFSLQKNQTWSLMDVTTTFLYRDLEGVMYMAEPKGYEVKGFHKNSYDACVYWKLSQKVSTPIVSHFRLSSSRCPVTEQERLDLGYAISMISRFMSNFGKEHWKAVKWVLCYLKGSASVSLCYSKDCDKSTLLEGFTNVDDAANLDKRRSHFSLVS
ncbi:Retrovirus-related Pol polyprotein from transposon TNT 1-94 [Cucumis melo var. makuwa]|uniref:Retrovirus-related Pol polyprotein from transposon TNT 1-94 n=1 Tax=Cucumis melo var. makuwa TaxID=1194695 RepID=A0A5D3CCI5_CUCMM|nr:Retrovirus-related Pol polyprotein from transposon TNT 1-94 [Cucumis melo var. makuwa]